MKRIANIMVALAMVAPAASAFRTTVDSSDLKLYDINVAVDEAAGKVRVKIDLDIDQFSVGKDREIVFTPVLRADNGSDSLLLEPVTIAGRNRWYGYLRNGFLDGGNSRIYRAGKGGHAVVSDEFDFLPWMSLSTLEMEAASANCCDRPDRLIGPSKNGDVPLAHIDVARPDFVPAFVFAPPVDAGPVIKKIEGSAFVTFVVNRTELKPDYMKNRSELAKIINSIEYVRRDTDATITHVHIKGFASPEGPYDNNVRLAKGRTETLRRYVRDLYSFPDTTVSSSYEPEDWAGLRNYVTDSMDFDIQHRPEIIEIIDGPLGFDNKNLAIQTQFPADYAVILKQIYPWLRHSDYTVTYAIKTYTTLEDIRRAYAADPSRLRNVDFYTLAQAYEPGSQDYCDVFEKAVIVYPDDPMLNLNAANIEMRRSDYVRAQAHLAKAGDSPEAQYARGILAAKLGDLTKATDYFSLASKGGMPGCDLMIQNVEAIRDYHPVTYLIKPLKDSK